jgi:hypothetical protein
MCGILFLVPSSYVVHELSCCAVPAFCEAETVQPLPAEVLSSLNDVDMIPTYLPGLNNERHGAKQNRVAIV